MSPPTQSLSRRSAFPQSHIPILQDVMAVPCLGTELYMIDTPYPESIANDRKLQRRECLVWWNDDVKVVKCSVLEWLVSRHTVLGAVGDKAGNYAQGRGMGYSPDVCHILTGCAVSSFHGASIGEWLLGIRGPPGNAALESGLAMSPAQLQKGRGYGVTWFA